MKEKKITVLMVEPGKHPVVTTLGNKLGALQKAVGIGMERRILQKCVYFDKGLLFSLDLCYSK